MTTSRQMKRIDRGDSPFDESVVLDSATGPAIPLSNEAQRALIADTIRRAKQAPRARVIRFPRATLIGLGVAALAAGAAAYSVGTRYWADRAEPTPASPLPAPADQTSTQLAARRTAETEADPPTTEPVPSAAEAVGPHGEDGAVSAPEAPPRTVQKTTSKSQRHVQQPEVAAAAELVSEPEAVDGLRRANELRRQKHYREALAAYLDIIDGYPRSLQAQAARVAAASLKLEHLGDAEGAEELYGSAERSGRALGAEATFGLAETHRARGDHAAEHRALQRLLRESPDSPLAAPARRRLDELAPPPQD